MGTRRSRHNKGRKPLYKEHRRNLVEDPAEERAYEAFVKQRWPGGTPRCPQCESADHYWYRKRKVFKCKDCGRQFSATADTPFSSRKIPFTTVMKVTRLKPCSVTDLMNHAGMTYRAAWQLRNRLAETYPEWRVTIRHQSAPVLKLSYPYIARQREEHADVMAVVALVPRGIPDDIRADICQEVIMALLEQRTSLDELRANKRNVSFFVRRFYKDNFEQAGHALSLDATDSDGRSYDEIASSVAARDWVLSEKADLARYSHALSVPFVPPTQIKDVWGNQVRREQERLSDTGLHLSFEEVAEMLESNPQLLAA